MPNDTIVGKLIIDGGNILILESTFLPLLSYISYGIFWSLICGVAKPREVVMFIVRNRGHFPKSVDDLKSHMATVKL